ncbi:MAG: hypothetical protein JJU10_00360 [Idiomarina sp.]|nr:hypothetical protein [Idiomarina sp.]
MKAEAQQLHFGRMTTSTILGVILIWAMVSLFLSDLLQVVPFSQLALFLSPVVLGSLWFIHWRMSNTVIAYDRDAIWLTRNDKEAQRARWDDVYHIEVKRQEKHLLLLNKEGQVIFTIPRWLHDAEALKTVVTRRVKLNHEDAEQLTFYGDVTYGRDFFYGLITFVSLFFILPGFVYLLGIHDFARAREWIGDSNILYFLLLVFILKTYFYVRMPTKAEVKPDCLEITFPIWTFRIPYAQIRRVELKPNPWAPVLSKRQDLIIHRRDFPRTMTVRAFWLRLESLESSINERLR